MAEQSQVFGGDDTGSTPPAQERKKPDLKKYINKPDLNIRDLFWTIMEAYKKKEDVRDQLKNFYGQRISLLRIAITVATEKKNYQFHISQNNVATYMLRIILDEKWEDVFLQFLESTYDLRKGIQLPFIVGMTNVFEDPDYKPTIIEYLRKNLREAVDLEATLAYISSISNKELSSELKKELLIIATQDIDENQHYALSALSNIVDDESVRKPLLKLIGDWDEQTRKIVVEIMKDVKDEALLTEAKKFIESESNPFIKSSMKKIIENNGG